MVVEVAVLVSRPGRRAGAAQHAPALFPLRMLALVYTDVFRGVPDVLLIYLFGFGVPALDSSGLPEADRARRPRRHRARRSVHGLRRRGLPRRPPVGAPRPARSRPCGRAHRAAGDAPRRPSAGRPQGRPPAPERLHLAAEGRRADLDHRGRGRGIPRRRRSQASTTSTTRPSSPPPSCTSRSRCR